MGRLPNKDPKPTGIPERRRVDPVAFIPLDEALNLLGKAMYPDEWNGKETDSFHPKRRARIDQDARRRANRVSSMLRQAMRHRKIALYVRLSGNLRVLVDHNFDAVAPYGLDIYNGECWLSESEPAVACEVGKQSLVDFFPKPPKGKTGPKGPRIDWRTFDKVAHEYMEGKEPRSFGRSELRHHLRANLPPTFVWPGKSGMYARLDKLLREHEQNSKN